MKKFKFKFQQILDLRSHKVDRAKNELAEVIGQRVKREEEINFHKKEIGALLNEETGNSVAYMQARFHRIEFLEKQIEELYSEIKEIKVEEEKKRKKLAEFMKDEKIMEKLKEKGLDEFKEEIKKEENAFLDEIASKRAQK